MASKPAPVRTGHDKTKGNGFALHPTSGRADPRDAEFERM